MFFSIDEAFTLFGAIFPGKYEFRFSISSIGTGIAPQSNHREKP
jgi:hypothetical protein